MHCDLHTHSIFSDGRYTPAEIIKEAKEKATPIYYGIEPDGTMYFYHGSTKIKVTEYFNDTGKPITALVEDVIQYAVQK